MVNKPRYDGIDIQTALDSIATAFHFDADALIDYAATDPHGGYSPKEGGDGFPIGSMWRVEGQILYALVLHMAFNNPNMRCVELGTHYGCSATHIAQALHDADTGGTLICVDLNGAAGNMIPAHLLPHIEFVRGDMFDFLARASEDGAAKFDFILEDGSHGTDDVENVWRSAYQLLKPGGLIVSHDAEHFVVGADVREGMARAGYFGLMPPARTYLIEPSDCGFGMWRKPVDMAQSVEEVPQEKRKNDEVSVDIPSIGALLESPDLSAMTIAELKAYADGRGISLTGLRTKGEIIAAIEAA